VNQLIALRSRSGVTIESVFFREKRIVVNINNTCPGETSTRLRSGLSGHRAPLAQPSFNCEAACDRKYYTPLGYVLFQNFISAIFLDCAKDQMPTLPKVVPYVGSKGNAVGALEWRAKPRLPPQL
jgi:hypothetical protein